MDARLRWAGVHNKYGESGDASKLDMYRGVTVWCSFSRLFERVFSSVFEHWFITDDLQCDFKHTVVAVVRFDYIEEIICSQSFMFRPNHGYLPSWKIVMHH